MTDGLALLWGWLAFLAMLGVLGYYLSRPSRDDDQGSAG